MESKNTKNVSLQYGVTKSRQSNIELYRIIVMMLIVAHHYVVNSGLLDIMSHNVNSIQTVYLYLLGMWGKTGINCFILITGYFMCKSHITCRKFLKLLLEVLFYNIVCWGIFTLSGYEQFSIRRMIFDIIPIGGVAYGFTSCFLIFYLFIPFLNILIRQMNKKKHAYLMMLCLTVYTVLGSIPKFHVTFNYVTWFCVLYVISSYIRIYGILPKIRTASWGYITLLLVVFSSCSVLAMLFLHIHYGVKLMPYKFMQDSNQLLAVLVSISSFMYFKSIHIKHSKLINIISASTFGVLCIHTNSSTMRQWLWKDMLECTESYTSSNIYIVSILTILLVFFICVILDYVRIHTIECHILAFIDKQLAKYNLE